MLISRYDSFVKRSDWTNSKDTDERSQIARYGIASEIGSLVSAVKKGIVISSGRGWNIPTEEIEEELGDITWYAAMLANLNGKGSLSRTIVADLSALPEEIEGDKIFKKLLDKDDFVSFKSQSVDFIKNYKLRNIDEYQKIAFLTARTRGQELLHVCLTRLLFYATVMMSKGFPQVEKLLQNDINDLALERTLGMIMWHISAVATLYNLNLSDILEKNIEKINGLSNIENDSPTPLHDKVSEIPALQKFPREFSVSFITVEEGKLQMYYNGLALGDELTDNSRKNDGYRFHDIMHLANAAKLGWSPVLRSLMKRKRKYDPVIDSAEDGARARIVEELVVKAIHSEGEREGGSAGSGGYVPVTLFTTKDQIPFSLLKLIKRFVKGLEVESNRYWEWQEAIVEGHKIYAQLHKEGQGTVRVNMNKRSISFDPKVNVEIKGIVIGVGTALSEIGGINLSILTPKESKASEGNVELQTRIGIRKKAILNSLELPTDDPDLHHQIELVDIEGGKIGVKVRETVQKTMWKKKVISFNPTETMFHNTMICHINAIADLPALH